jgi:hypothetical protein
VAGRTFQFLFVIIRKRVQHYEKEDEENCATWRFINFIVNLALFQILKLRRMYWAGHIDRNKKSFERVVR